MGGAEKGAAVVCASEKAASLSLKTESTSLRVLSPARSLSSRRTLAVSPQSPCACSPYHYRLCILPCLPRPALAMAPTKDKPVSFDAIIQRGMNAL